MEKLSINELHNYNGGCVLAIFKNVFISVIRIFKGFKTYKGGRR